MNRIYQSVMVSIVAVTLAIAGCGGELQAPDTPDQSLVLPENPGAFEPGKSATLVGKVINSDASLAMVVQGDTVLAYVSDGDDHKHTFSAWFAGPVVDGEFSLLSKHSSSSQAHQLSGVVSQGVAVGTLIMANGVERDWATETADSRSDAGLYVNETETSLTGIIVTNDLVVKGGALKLEPVANIPVDKDAREDSPAADPVLSGPILVDTRFDAFTENISDLISLPIIIDKLSTVDKIGLIGDLRDDLVVVETPVNLPPIEDVDLPPAPEGTGALEQPGVIKAPTDVVVVKFIDDKYRIRLIKKDSKDPHEKGFLEDLKGKGLTSPFANEVLEYLKEGQWARSFEASPEQIDELRLMAMKRTNGEHFTDLNNYFALKLPEGVSREEAREALLKLDEVENVFYVPDLYTATAEDYAVYRGAFSSGGQNFEYPYQKYLDAAPVGVDARYAWLYIGGDGAGVTFVDIEYGYDYDHQDLPNITNIGVPFDTATLDPEYTDHGTATLGVVAGIDNGSGVTGIAHAAEVRMAAKGGLPVDYPLGWAFGLENTIFATFVQSELQPGDVILLEQQLDGPNRPQNPQPGDQFGLVAVEWYKPAYDVIRIATANGYVVVEAAGNGEQNLDALEYLSDPFATHRPFLVVNGERVNDSGAIIVGAGEADSDWSQFTQVTGIPRSMLFFSNYGARVDVQCWGDSVVTAGPGLLNSFTLYDADGPHNTFRRDFGGTSSASAIMGGVATSLQGAYKQNMDDTLRSREMRDLLIATGTPQAGDLSMHIGPQPDLRAALEQALEFTPAPTFGLNEQVAAAEFCDDGTALPMPLVEFSVPPGMLAEGQDLQLQLLFGEVTVEGARIHYTLDGTLPTLCNEAGVPGCNSNTLIWTQQDLISGSSIVIPYEELPVSIYAIQTTDACGVFQRPVSELAAANYVRFSEIPGPVIYLADDDTNPDNDIVEHQASKIFTRDELAALPNGELCVRFDTTLGSSVYIRYTIDGSDPLDTTEGNWEDPYGVIPHDATPIFDTQVNASPIWTDYNTGQGQCVPIFSADAEADTLVTVKAQNFVYPGGGSYVGGTITVESYLLVD